MGGDGGCCRRLLSAVTASARCLQVETGGTRQSQAEVSAGAAATADAGTDAAAAVGGDSPAGGAVVTPAAVTEEKSHGASDGLSKKSKRCNKEKVPPAKKRRGNVFPKPTEAESKLARQRRKQILDDRRLRRRLFASSGQSQNRDNAVIGK